MHVQLVEIYVQLNVVEAKRQAVKAGGCAEKGGFHNRPLTPGDLDKSYYIVIICKTDDQVWKESLVPYMCHAQDGHCNIGPKFKATYDETGLFHLI